MYDYYRVRFRKILKPARPISELTLPGTEPVPMPKALVVVSWSSVALTGIGMAFAAAAGRTPLGSSPSWLTALVLPLPVTFTLAVGFSEQQSWTRPLLVVLVAAASVAAALCGLRAVFLVLMVAAAVTACYLYGSPAVKAYYSYLRENAIVRVAAADLRSTVFIPLYTGAVGFLAGVALGWYLASSYLERNPSPGGWSIHDVYGLVLGCLLYGSILAYLGRLVGEALVSRPSRGGWPGR